MNSAEPPFSLAAQDPAPADLQADMARLTLTRQARTGGASGATIDRAQGGTNPKLAKRDHKRLHAATRRAWYLQQNRES